MTTPTMKVHILFFPVVCGISCHTAAVTQFERLFQYDNVEVLNNTIYQREGSDITDCAHACAHDAECFLFSHNSLAQSCKLYSNVSTLPHWSSGTAAPGSRLYQVLLSKKDWCPTEDGWTKVEEGPVCFNVSKVNLPWQEAREECLLNGGDLIVLDEPWKQTLLTNRVENLDVVQKGYPLYVGLTDSATEGAFKWLNGSVISSTDAFWMDGQPNGGDYENCGGLIQGKLLDIHCLENNKFICEKLPTKT